MNRILPKFLNNSNPSEFRSIDSLYESRYPMVIFALPRGVGGRESYKIMGHYHRRITVFKKKSIRNNLHCIGTKKPGENGPTLDNPAPSDLKSATEIVLKKESIVFSIIQSGDCFRNK